MSRLRLLLATGVVSLGAGAVILIWMGVSSGIGNLWVAVAGVALVFGIAALNLGVLGLLRRGTRFQRSSQHTDSLLRDRTKRISATTGSMRASIIDLTRELRSLGSSVPDRSASLIVKELDQRHLESLKALELVEERVANIDQRVTRLRERVVEWLQRPEDSPSVSVEMNQLSTNMDLALVRIDEVNRDIGRELKLATSRLEAVTRICTSLPLRRPLPPFGDWAIAPDMAFELIDLVLRERPVSIVEIGSGLSTVLFAYALELNGEGELLALEHDQIYADRTQEQLDTHGVAGHAHVAFAPLESMELGGQVFRWYSLESVELPDQIDLVLVDGPPATTNPLARYPAFPLLAERLGPDATVILDDTNRGEESEIVQRWQSEFEGLTVKQLNLERGAVVLKRG